MSFIYLKSEQKNAGAHSILGEQQLLGMQKQPLHYFFLASISIYSLVQKRIKLLTPIISLIK